MVINWKLFQTWKCINKAFSREEHVHFPPIIQVMLMSGLLPSIEAHRRAAAADACAVLLKMLRRNIQQETQPPVLCRLPCVPSAHLQTKAFQPVWLHCVCVAVVGKVAHNLCVASTSCMPVWRINSVSHQLCVIHVAAWDPEVFVSLLGALADVTEGAQQGAFCYRGGISREMRLGISSCGLGISSK